MSAVAPTPAFSPAGLPVAAVIDRRAKVAPRSLVVGGHRPPLQVLFAMIVAFSCVVSGFAQRTTLADGLKAAVLRADEARVYAMLTPDVGALDDMLTSDCLYVHSNGVVHTKAELLGALKSGAMRYTVLRYVTPPQVRLYGTEAAVLNGTTQIEVVLADGRVAKPTLLITAVYVVKDGRWQLASYQSTTVPAAK